MWTTAGRHPADAFVSATGFAAKSRMLDRVVKRG
jgi:hypothetical protein